MSSVFLYVAIVAIWAFVLVPRWIRRHHAQPEPELAGAEGVGLISDTGPASFASPQPPAASPAPEPAPHFEAAPAPPRVNPATGHVVVAAGRITPADAPAARPARPVRQPAATPRPAAPEPPVPATRRSPHVVRARRRLFAGLALLTTAAAAAAVIHATSWWLCLAPGLVLLTYMILLRGATRADAERVRRHHTARVQRARKRADTRRRAHAEAVAMSVAEKVAGAVAGTAAEYAVAAAAQAQAQVPAQHAEPSADVIDISARRAGDQFYDQVADAAAAVGD